MAVPAFSFEGKQITVGDHHWTTAFPISECVMIGDKIIVIYEATSVKQWEQFHNLEAFDLHGQKIWTAEHLTNETADVYLQILRLDPFTVLNFAGFTGQVDIATGKLLKTEFTK